MVPAMGADLDTRQHIPGGRLFGNRIIRIAEQGGPLLLGNMQAAKGITCGDLCDSFLLDKIESGLLAGSPQGGLGTATFREPFHHRDGRSTLRPTVSALLERFSANKNRE